MLSESVIIYFFILAFGLCIGSFMNVCIYRLPVSKSIAYPPSSCPNCGYMIRFYDNIPILSYIFLKGKCRECRTSISIRYPLVELLSGLLALCVYLKSGLSLEALVYYIFISVLVIISFIDIDHRIIPNIISLPGIPIFFLASFAVPSVSWIDSLTGIITGGGSLYLVAWVYSSLTGKEGMGGGDIKLLAMIGAMIGWKGVLFTIFTGSAIGTLAGLAIMIYKRGNMKLAVPFGPFLAIGAVTYIFFGTEIIYWYFNLMR